MVADVSRVCGLAIIDVTDGVADRHEESIVHEQISDVNYQESLGDSKTDICVQQCRNRVLAIEGARNHAYCPCMQCSLSSGGANRGC